MAPKIICYVCQIDFPLDLETLRPYRNGLIQGQRLPRYWVRCPECGQKNIIELTGVSDVIAGKPSVQ